MRAQIVGTVLTGWLVGCQQIVGGADWQPDSPPDLAFRFFAALSTRDLDTEATLELIRPLPIGVDEKRRVLAQSSLSICVSSKREIAGICSLKKILSAPTYIPVPNVDNLLQQTIFAPFAG